MYQEAAKPHLRPRMPAGGGQYLKLSMIVFSNHSMGLVGAWRLPEIDSDKSTTTLPAEDCLKMRMHQVPQAVLCSLFGSYIELVPPPLGFAPSFAEPKVA